VAFDTVANIVTDAAIQLGFVSSAISDPYAETDDNIVRLRYSLKQLGQDLVRQYNWSHLQEEHTFSTSNGTANYDLPTYFARIVNGTVWNRTQTRRMVGPIDGQKWQRLKANAATFIDQAFRIWQDDVWIYPTPTATETVAYEYISKLWVAATGQTAPNKEHPTLSTDELWFDRDLLVWGLRLYSKRDNGFPSEAEQVGFDAALAAALGGDGASPVLSATGAPDDFEAYLVPETGFGS
jgi:hypothetical protein